MRPLPSGSRDVETDDGWSCEVTFDPEVGLMLDDPDECPHCGQDTIFNGIIAVNGQFVASPTGIDPDGSHHVDDWLGSAPLEIRCGNPDCREKLASVDAENLRDSLD
jgi:hypothetical protein